MKINTLVSVLAVISVALAGCSSKSAEPDDVVIPGSINEQTVKDLEERAIEQYPRVIEFPGQADLAPIKGLFEGTLSQFAGAGVEWPADDGSVRAGGETLLFDLASELDIPENQPVEIRIKLKWWGDPASAVDMDIFVDVPGEKDSYDGTSYDESWNWNIVTKFRVVNTVHEPGLPLNVGMELQNGKIAHPDGVRWELHYEVHMPGNVLAPGIPYGITVPDTASVLILESEPIVGDEHVTSDIVIFGPNDEFIQFLHHNDIASETQRINLRGGGQYVMYAQHYHGGFVRVETDVQNPDWQAVILPKEVGETIAFSGAAPAPSGRPESGDIDIGGPILDLKTFIRLAQPGAAGADAEIAVANDGGDYHVTTMSAQASSESTPGGVRAGAPTSSYKPGDEPNFDGGPWRFEGRSNSEGLELGYEYVTYTR